jgi:ubiquinone/menaquinone biosynthesis C-methylase UbiE
MIAPARERTARLYARLAFGPAAAVYDLLTAQPAWRRDCRDLGALVDGPRVLDLGVGSGTSAVEMARTRPATRHVGVDLSAAMLRRAARRARRAAVALPLVRGDALRLPVRDGAFDGATAHSVLYLLPEPAAALGELRRAVRPGGRMAFLEPRAAPGSLRGALRSGARHAAAMALWRTMSAVHRRWDEPSLAALLRAAGLEDVRAWAVLDGFGVMAVATRPAAG